MMKPRPMSTYGATSACRFPSISRTPRISVSYPFGRQLSVAAKGPGLAEHHPPLTAHEALVESNRCLFCYDAPCTHACPTHVDIPRFIKKISTDNVIGSAKTILAANLLGATCARV